MRKRQAIFRSIVQVILLFLVVLPVHAELQPPCPKVPPIALDLPRFRAALARSEPIIIVAFGSSSTEGSAASDKAHSYPAILQAVLSSLLPAAHIAVINRGIGGQDAAEELVRIGRDVTAIRPQLVIWQIGANAAIRNEDPGSFRSTVAAGVRRMKDGGSDVILMDNQRARRVLEAPRRAAIEQALATVAHDSGGALFSRGALMDAWAATGAAYERYLASDGLHHNDLGYRCVAMALADAIIAGLQAH